MLYSSADSQSVSSTTTTDTGFWHQAVISSLDYDRIVRAWPEKVFSLLSSARGLRRWLAPRILAEVKEGGIYLFSWGRHGTVTGEFIEVVENRLLRFTWEDQLSRESLVTIELRGAGIKTHIRVSHELFGGSTKWEWNDGHLNEWIFFLDNLCSIAEVDVDLRETKCHENGWEWVTGHFHTTDQGNL